jgi:hypothetical protein
MTSFLQLQKIIHDCANFQQEGPGIGTRGTVLGNAAGGRKGSARLL